MKTTGIFAIGLLSLLPFTGFAQDWNDISGSSTKDRTEDTRNNNSVDQSSTVYSTDQLSNTGNNGNGDVEILKQGNVAVTTNAYYGGNVTVSDAEIDAYNRRGHDDQSQDQSTDTLNAGQNYQNTDSNTSANRVVVSSDDPINVYVGSDDGYYSNNGWAYGLNFGWGLGGFGFGIGYGYYGYCSPWYYGSYGYYGYPYYGYYNPWYGGYAGGGYHYSGRYNNNGRGEGSFSTRSQHFGRSDNSNTYNTRSQGIGRSYNSNNVSTRSQGVGRSYNSNNVSTRSQRVGRSYNSNNVSTRSQGVGRSYNSNSNASYNTRSAVSTNSSSGNYSSGRSSFGGGSGFSGGGGGFHGGRR